MKSRVRQCAGGGISMPVTRSFSRRQKRRFRCAGIKTEQDGIPVWVAFRPFVRLSVPASRFARGSPLAAPAAPRQVIHDSFPRTRPWPMVPGSAAQFTWPLLFLFFSFLFFSPFSFRFRTRWNFLNAPPKMTARHLFTFWGTN